MHCDLKTRLVFMLTLQQKKCIRYQLYENDFERRTQFCQWFVNQCNNGRFLSHIVLRAEGVFLYHNSHYTEIKQKY